MNTDGYISVRFALINVLKSVGVIIAAAFLFFNSIFGIIILIPYGLFTIYKIAKSAGESLRSMVVMQFKDMLSCMLTAMEAGASVERAVSAAYDDLIVMYNEKAYIVKKTQQMLRRLELSENIEDIFLRFAEETHVKEIENFADIFLAAKRTGGDIISLIRSATEDLYEKIEVRREIEGIIASGRMECAVMKVMPLAILFYLRIFSGGLLIPLYTTLIGRLLMIVVAIAYFSLSEYSDHLVSRALS